MKDISTDAIHGGDPHPRVEGAVTLPIFQSATYEFGDHDDYYDIKYARLNNSPNHIALNKKLALLEGGEAALVLGSGMAAIATTALGLLSKGDHILAQSTVYGGTWSLFKNDLPRFGITCDFVDPKNFADHIRGETKMIYVESISNPLMEVPDFKAITTLARQNRLLTVIDNTFATPVNFRPIEHGFDLSLHSATKYLNGHSDVVAGCVVGRKDLIAKINHMAVYLGGTLDPHACFMLDRGLKTLQVRVEKHNQSARKIAEHLRAHAKVKQVYYPGYGGMLSFELNNGGATEQFIGALKIAVHAPSLGGVESLVIQPSRSSHASLTQAERNSRGITDGLIRFSVGLESVADLIGDLDRALAET